MPMSDTIVLAIQVYGLAIAISVVAALIIRGIVYVLPMMQREEKPAPAAAPAGVPAVAGIPPEHVAAISAAVASLIGDVHIVHIDDRGRGVTWTTESRIIHQTSHAPRQTRR